MYRAFFHLKRNPFELAPDPYFTFPTPHHHEAFASLYYGITSRKGFLVLSGEVGTGKTLVLRCLILQLQKQNVHFAYVFNPLQTPEEFLRYMMSDLDLPGEYKGKNDLLFSLYASLAKRHNLGQTTVLIVDEAHLLSREVLEEIRLLGNLENQGGKLLQVALVGQPELDSRLDSLELRQLKQRIALRCQLHPLTHDQTGEYINWRLARAGADGKAPIFSREAIAGIFEYSRGYPRLINSICENALIFACGKQMSTIDRTLIMEVCADLRLEPEMDSSPDSPSTEARVVAVAPSVAQQQCGEVKTKASTLQKGSVLPRTEVRI